jgi:hypothetical protein
MKHTISTLPLFVAMLLAGCVSTNVTPLNNKKYVPIQPAEVVIYLDEADVPGAYEKVAIMYARGDYALTDESQMLKRVRKKAADLGANGVLVQRIQEPKTGEKVAQVFLGTEADRSAELIAIFVLPKNEASL